MVIASLVLGAWFVYPVFRLQYEHQQELESVELELASVKDRNAELRQRLEDLSTPAGVEELARQSLGYVKAGEQAYVVTTEESTATVTADASSGESLWQQAIDLVFGLQ